MVQYSIYATYRHPDSGRELATIEFDVCDSSDTAEYQVEYWNHEISTMVKIDHSMFGLVRRALSHAYPNIEPLVVTMKKVIS